jgi:hypothetical protein
MIFNSKQLERLENIHDSSGIFEDDASEQNTQEISEAAMEWRSALIEEAAESVKRAKTRPVDPNITYEINSLLFDRETRRFGRVQRSVPGSLKIGYLTGGEREYGNLDIELYLTEFGAQKALSELAGQLGLAPLDVMLQLDRLGIQPLEETVNDEETAEGSDAKGQLDGEKGAGGTSGKLAGENEASANAKNAAAPGGAAAGAEEAAIPTTPAAKQKRAAGTKATRKKSGTKAKTGKKSRAVKPPPLSAGPSNPIDDPNGYIRKNYLEMSNREMARVTGLSEHTIRRKLGEWGLKRKK